ncbi:MAG: AAA family ATPase [Phycisphaerae bacterium]
MRSIAIINQKGGCGKTTTAINLSACLARLGHKTLLVDMDPQGHCAVGLAVPEEQVERTMLDALSEPAVPLEQVTWQIATDFDLAPSNIRLAAFEQTFAGRDGRDDRLAEALAGVDDKYGWCIIDCPPSVGLLTFNALKACDEVIIPVETGYFSLHGLAKVIETLDELQHMTGRSPVIRVLPTLYDTRTKLAREVISELRTKFKGYLMTSTVNFNTKLKEAASFGQPITEYDPGSRGYKDFVNLARELMGDKPVQMERPATSAELSRPAELVQRARQLAQLTNFKFGRGTVQVPEAPGTTLTLDAPAAVNGLTNGHANGQANGNGNGYANGYTNGTAAEPTTPKATTEPAAQARNAFLEPQPEPAAGTATNAPAANAPAAAAPAEPKTTEQKIAEFYGARQIGDEVIFRTRLESAKRVAIAGDFNGWNGLGTPLTNGEAPGVFSARLPLEPGTYRYRLVVDGRWMTDPHNSYTETNEFGELNNVVIVE